MFAYYIVLQETERVGEKSKGAFSEEEFHCELFAGGVYMVFTIPPFTHGLKKGIYAFLYSILR